MRLRGRKRERVRESVGAGDREEGDGEREEDARSREEDQDAGGMKRDDEGR